MLGASIAAPLAMPPTVQPSPLDDDLLADGVGGHDRPGRVGPAVGVARGGDASAMPAVTRSPIERDADEAGGAHEDVARRRSRCAAAVAAHIASATATSVPGGAVGVAAVEHDRRGLTAGGREVALATPAPGPAQARFWVKTPAAATGLAVGGGDEGEVGVARSALMPDVRTPAAHEAPCGDGDAHG